MLLASLAVLSEVMFKPKIEIVAIDACDSLLYPKLVLHSIKHFVD